MASSQDSFGSGQLFRHSMETWRGLIRQAWLSGLLNRQMKRGIGTRMVNGVIFNVYDITNEGITFLTKPREILLSTDEPESPEQPAKEETLTTKPTANRCDSHICKSLSHCSTKSVLVFTHRKGMGSQAITSIRNLMTTSENWFPITSNKDYHFPGVFEHLPPKRMGYCSDITMLPNYEKSDPDFMYTDIQLGKGKARNQREVTLNVDGANDDIIYRIVPCGGVKVCSDKSCSYVVSTRETKPCPDHPNKKLERSGYCPVEFVYLKPKDPSDSRRWLTGLIRGPQSDAQNLHNHALHGDLKIPGKVDADIRRAIISNPQLKTKDIVIGKCNNSVFTDSQQ